MKIRDINKPDDLIQYLRDFKGWESDEVYDFNFISYLFLAILDNIKQFGLEHELDNIGYNFNDSQREFLTQLAKKASQITDQQIALEDAEEMESGQSDSEK